MPQKIFISYRRQDTAANALGIGQYLEHEFGRKNVFIDVDMRAGAKFPTVLEKRLAECKVMLVLIGPEWPDLKDDDGSRRLDNANDWVRLGIAHALRRDITVIPVRVNGAGLPNKAALPEDIRGLLDHQAASVTNAGFRHEMSGIAKDIRSIESPRPWRRFGVIAAGFVCLLVALAAVQVLGLLNSFVSLHFSSSSQPLNIVTQNGAIWSTSPGEWVLFATDKVPGVGYYFKPGALRKFGDHGVLVMRSPFKPADVPGTGPLGAYQDGQVVIDCKNHNFANAETAIYNKAGEIISHFKQAEPEALTPAAFNPIPPSSVLSGAERFACDESLATSLGDQVKNAKLTYFSSTQTQDGDMFYGPAKKAFASPYQHEVLLVTKLFQDHSLADLFAIKLLFNYPYTYRSLASVTQFNCTDEKAQSSKTDNFDAQGNLVFINSPVMSEFNVKDGTVVGILKSRICGATATNIAGTYEGTLATNYKRGDRENRRFRLPSKRPKTN